MPSEVELAAILCALVLGGETETRHGYVVAGEARHVRVDCETPTHVIEVGLDGRRSAYDSLHQSLFAAHLTGKLPMIVMIDTDGREEPAEFQVRTVAGMAGVSYLALDAGFLLRWQRERPGRKGPDLPVLRDGATSGH
ncbi:hypothetical protein [Rhodovulum sp. MB263]|uniref:hypothetical protein n=1 Tax=Rhodovulum sp. (strain MB263) TaxID=308754 RepID=UPI0018C87F27|nr:hypothetical protein [Rhodovulum sp. MB263]